MGSNSTRLVPHASVYLQASTQPYYVAFVALAIYVSCVDAVLERQLPGNDVRKQIRLIHEGDSLFSSGR